MGIKLFDIGMVMVLVGFIWGVLACGLLARNELNTYILMGFGGLFSGGLILMGVSLVKRKVKWGR